MTRKRLRGLLSGRPKGERDHRRFGALFTHGAARYYHSCADAARLFTIKWVVEGCAPPKNWLAVTTWREDARWGFAVHDAIMALDPGFVWPEVTWDYAVDVAAGCADAT